MRLVRPYPIPVPVLIQHKEAHPVFQPSPGQATPARLAHPFSQHLPPVAGKEPAQFRQVAPGQGAFEVNKSFCVRSPVVGRELCLLCQLLPTFTVRG